MGLIKIYNKKIKKNIFLRENDETDRRIYEDTFEGLYHMPPKKISPLTVLDLGCNIGLTLAHYEYMWPNAVTMGVDLDQDNLMVARSNNPDSALLQAGVSTEDGESGYSPRKLSWAYSLNKRGSVRVQTYKMSTLIDMLGGFVDFVKMDIEGEEKNIILKDDSWKNNVKYLLVEVHGSTDEKRNDNFFVVEERLRKDGFITQLHNIHWSAVWAERYA